jgi:hypothetical protein
MPILSWSTINQYLICPLRLKYEFEHRSHSTSWTMSYGDAGHYALAAWANGRNWQEAFQERCAEYEKRTIPISDWDGTFSDMETGAIQKAQIKDLLNKYISAQEEMGNRPDPRAVEFCLNRDLGNGIILTGRIDWFGSPVVDWKFTTSPKYLSPIQPLIYALLNGSPCEFEYHAMVKDRNPWWEVFSVPETNNQQNLDRVMDHIIKPIANCINNNIYMARPDSSLCKKRYCGYWENCEGRLVA